MKLLFAFGWQDISPGVKAIYLPWFQLSSEGSKALSSYIRHPWHQSSSESLKAIQTSQVRKNPLSSPLGRYFYIPYCITIPSLHLYQNYICNLFMLPPPMPSERHSLYVAYPHLVSEPSLWPIPVFVSYWNIFNQVGRYYRHSYPLFCGIITLNVCYL